MPIGDDLQDLEHGIKKLQIEWEKFFGGIERKPPNDLRTRIEAMLRRYAAAEIRNSTERFRYQTLQARYNTFSELWNKRLRAIEEGRPMGMYGRAAQLYQQPGLASADMPSLEGHHVAAPLVPPPREGEIRVESPELDVEAMKALYDNFLDARAQTGEKGAVKFDSFQKLITQQTTRIITERGALAVDFRLEAKDGKVSLKARAVK